MSHSVPLPPALPPLWAPRGPAVAQPASSGARRRPPDRQRWGDPAAVGARPDISCMQAWSLTAADSCTVTVRGEIDSVTAPGLQEVLLDVLEAPLPSGGIVVDLRGVTFVGAAGLTVLAVSHHLAENAGGVLWLRCGTARAVIRPLQITGLWDLLNIVDRQHIDDDC